MDTALPPPNDAFIEGGYPVRWEGCVVGLPSGGRARGRLGRRGRKGRSSRRQSGKEGSARLTAAVPVPLVCLPSPPCRSPTYLVAPKAVLLLQATVDESGVLPVGVPPQ